MEHPQTTNYVHIIKGASTQLWQVDKMIQTEFILSIEYENLVKLAEQLCAKS